MILIKFTVDSSPPTCKYYSHILIVCAHREHAVRRMSLPLEMEERRRVLGSACEPEMTDRGVSGTTIAVNHYSEVFTKKPPAFAVESPQSSVTIGGLPKWETEAVQIKRMKAGPAIAVTPSRSVAKPAKHAILIEANGDQHTIDDPLTTLYQQQLSQGAAYECSNIIGPNEDAIARNPNPSLVAKVGSRIIHLNQVTSLSLSVSSTVRA